MVKYGTLLLIYFERFSCRWNWFLVFSVMDTLVPSKETAFMRIRRSIRSIARLQIPMNFRRDLREGRRSTLPIIKSLLVCRTNKSYFHVTFMTFVQRNQQFQTSCGFGQTMICILLISVCCCCGLLRPAIDPHKLSLI